jgi:predicted XRE-type DNA-binding protein
MTGTKAYRNIWEAIEPTPVEAQRMAVRADLMHAIREVIDRWNITQAQAAKRLKISQPRLNDMLRGKLDKFSLDALLELAGHAGLSVKVKIGRQAA